MYRAVICFWRRRWRNVSFSEKTTHPIHHGCNIGLYLRKHDCLYIFVNGCHLPEAIKTINTHVVVFIQAVWEYLETYRNRQIFDTVP